MSALALVLGTGAGMDEPTPAGAIARRADASKKIMLDDNSTVRKDITGKHSAALTISSASSAIDAAIRVLGLEEETKSRCSAVLYEPIRDDTPFLSDSVLGKLVWTISIRGISFRGQSVAGVEGALVARFTKSMDFEVDLLAQPGALVRVVSTTPVDDPGVWARPSGVVAAERIGAGGNERWSGFLDGPPVSTLADVIQVIDGKMGGIDETREIVVHAVQWSMMGAPTRPVWSVDMRAIPRTAQDALNRMRIPPGPMPEFDEDSLRNSVNHIRHIVTDGELKWLTSGTTPQPDPPPGWKPRTMKKQTK